MTPRKDVNASTDIDFRAVRQRFRRLNQARLARARDALRDRQQEALDLLPLLFHINHPLLPGFISKTTPAGISLYEPQRRELDVARYQARSFEYRHLHGRDHPLLALYMMGSPGSIAYSEDSDFDIWLCHAPELGERQLAQLQQKATAIEKWAEGFDLEVHFFLVNIERFRSGEVLPMTSESAGSSQHHLLLEEFYRTAVLLAGQAPLWWMVPPVHEHEYEAYVADIKEKRFAHARDHVDFGGLTHIPAEEFFGAALWHIYKGIDSPYKAILKLLLMETYASEYPRIDLLSLRFKQAVYAGEDNPSRLDPYLLMLTKVEEYLQRQGDHERLELARRCFYFKADERLSAEARGAAAESWQRELMLPLIQAWQWSRADLLLMDEHRHWKVTRVAEERRRIFEALVGSYRFLSDFARRHAELSFINQRDLTVLGRKLYAAFERKAGKLELINRGINADLHEPAVTVQESMDETQQGGWMLFHGTLATGDIPREVPIKRSRNITELIAWCYFNGVVDRHTVVVLYPCITRIGPNDFKSVLERMHALFPAGCLDNAALDDYAAPAHILHSSIFINAELDTFTALSLDGHYSSARTDALRYGGKGMNLAQTMDLVIVTSWREVLTYHFRGGRGLMELLVEYFKWSPPSRGAPPATPEVFGISSQRGHLGAQRIRRLFHDLVATFYAPDIAPGTRYLVAIGSGYYLLRFDSDTLHYEGLPGFQALLTALGRPQRHFSPLAIDGHALTDSVLPLLYQRNRAGYVQFFYQPQDGTVDIHILDERGSLFQQTLPFYDTKALLNQYSRFFEAILNRINFLMQEGQQTSSAEGVEFYRIDTGKGGKLHLERQAPEFHAPDKQYFDLQVIVDTDENGRTVFSLYCGEREFTTLEHGSGLFDAVVQHVLEMRASGQHYPIYITDIGMSRAVIGEESTGKVQSVHFLNYKHRIETQLNRVLEARG